MSIAATVSFPGLGLGPFELNRVAFTIFGKEVYWYGVIIATGFFLGVSLALKLAELNGLDPDKIFNVVLITAPVAIVGARVYYVMTTLERYDSFYEMIAIWNGGIAIYGAVLAGMACIAVLCKLWKLPLLKVLDIAAPAVILGQGIGRWGNFVNREAFGGPTRNLFRMELIIDGVPTAVHPTFL
ncbi:MAG: prolipoprotein diacylglyceryl transferase, partial [Clostridia bacterium]|nr:prolipoprotein diacylglyceryl transferase [Clostridia bacterium]